MHGRDAPGGVIVRAGIAFDSSWSPVAYRPTNFTVAADSWHYVLSHGYARITTNPHKRQPGDVQGISYRHTPSGDTPIVADHVQFVTQVLNTVNRQDPYFTQHSGRIRGIDTIKPPCCHMCKPGVRREADIFTCALSTLAGSAAGVRLRRWRERVVAYSGGALAVALTACSAVPQPPAPLIAPPGVRVVSDIVGPALGLPDLHNRVVRYEAFASRALGVGDLTRALVAALAARGWRHASAVVTVDSKKGWITERARIGDPRATVSLDAKRGPGITTLFAVTDTSLYEESTPFKASPALRAAFRTSHVVLVISVPRAEGV